MAAQPPPVLTDFARLYGHNPNENFSNLTPVIPPFPGRESVAERQFRLQKEQYQRENLLGFTTRELANLDVISDRALKAGNLQNCILRIMSQDRWETSPPYPHWPRDIFYPVKNGHGFWTVSNPDVWRVLEPCLRMASRYVMSMHCLHWFNALINGQRKPIEKERAMHGESVDGLFSYHVPMTNSPDVSAVIRDQMLESLRVKWDLRWYFLSPNQLPNGYPLTPAGSISGICTTNDDEIRNKQGKADSRIGLFISYLNLELLLRNDLTPANRLTIEWDVANTIVHELMHAFQVPLSPGNILQRKEPYFELTPVAEIGFNYESEVLGGLTIDLIRKDHDSVPLGYWLEKYYPTFEHIAYKYWNTKVLINPAPIDHTIKYPIPVTFYQDVQQDNFWDVGIRMFGFPLLYYRSVKEGVQVNFRHHYNWVTHKHVWGLASGPLRLPGFHPFPHASAAFQAKLQQLDMVLGQTPYQRAAKAFGEEIVKSAHEEHAFWDSATSQQRRIDMVQVLAARPQGDDEERRALFAEMTMLLSEASYFHSNMAMSTIYSEQAIGIAYNDRRKSLLLWNRGFRGFLQELISTQDSNIDLVNPTKWQDIIYAIEACRLALWSPINGPEGDEQREYAQVLSMKNKAEGCEKICSLILEDMTASVFAKCCANITLCELESDSLHKLELRKENLNDQIALLEKLRGYDIRNWLDPINEWGNLAIQMRDSLLNLLHTAQPEDDDPLLASPPPSANYIQGLMTTHHSQRIGGQLDDVGIGQLRILQAGEPQNEEDEEDGDDEADEEVRNEQQQEEDEVEEGDSDDEQQQLIQGNEGGDNKEQEGEDEELEEGEDEEQEG